MGVLLLLVLLAVVCCASAHNYTVSHEFNRTSMSEKEFDQLHKAAALIEGIKNITAVVTNEMNSWLEARRNSSFEYGGDEPPNTEIFINDCTFNVLDIDVNASSSVRELNLTGDKTLDEDPTIVRHFVVSFDMEQLHPVDVVELLNFSICILDLYGSPGIDMTLGCIERTHLFRTMDGPTQKIADLGWGIERYKKYVQAEEDLGRGATEAHFGSSSLQLVETMYQVVTTEFLRVNSFANMVVDAEEAFAGDGTKSPYPDPKCYPLNGTFADIFGEGFTI